MKFTTFLNLLLNAPQKIGPAIFDNLCNCSIVEHIPDSLYLRIAFRLNTGRFLHLKKPILFTEKIQWLKLNDRKLEYVDLVDKFKVKAIVSSIIGSEYIIPTIAVWETPSDIDWNVLPNQFVLKTTHGGGGCGVVICKDKSSFDRRESITQLWKSYNSNIYMSYREWPYKNVEKKVIAEPFMVDKLSTDGDLIDYKFYCFNGVPKYCQVIRNRRKHETIDFFDMDWNLMPFIGLNPNVKNGSGNLPKPQQLNEMIEICKRLGKNKPFTRIDLYVINNRVYFGEITFYPASGFGRFEPEEWNIKLGNMITL